MVNRIFVEKRKGFDVAASGLKQDLIENLGIIGIDDVRIINRYDVSGLSQSELDRAIQAVFSEPNMDNVYDEDYIPHGYKFFAYEYLPGQYDQRADSASQCIQLLTHGERPDVLYARIIAVKGTVSHEDMERIKGYIINPVDSRVASMEKPKSLTPQSQEPQDVARVRGFTSMDSAAISEYYSSMGFAMSLEDLTFCRDYFKNEEKRDPTVTELRVIDTYWSDHCRHTTFLTRLEQIRVEQGKLSAAIEKSLEKYFSARALLYGDSLNSKDVSLMDMAVIGGKYLHKKGLVPDLDISEEINACSIETDVEIDGRSEKWLIQFKNETHNHPTEIEPFGGAATCLGGAIRDPLSGRAYVYQAMRVSGSSDPTVPIDQTIPGKLPTSKITSGAAAGYSSYGNQIGLATGQVTELYDAGYVAKRMEVGAVIGASPKENVRREAPKGGDVVVLLGGATGRDGIGGATGSSQAHTEKSVEICGAQVQKGNPPTERKLQRLFRNKRAASMIKRCNDFGAGGVCVAIGELADGLSIDLNAVPKKYDGLDGTELAISESQERMAVVLDSADAENFILEARKENLDATVVAVVTFEPRLKMRWRNDEIVNLSRKFLNTNGVTQRADAIISAAKGDSYRDCIPPVLCGIKRHEAIIKNMSRLEVAGQRGLCERFDSSIGAGTVLMPFAGVHQLTPEDAMVAKIPLETGETDDATAMAYGYIPGLFRYSPYMGAAFAVVESISKLVAVGADFSGARLTFQEYFERLYDNPKRWGKPAAALLGALDVQLGMDLPSIGGKDSMSGSFENLDVPPTLISFAVSMTKASRTISAAFQNKPAKVFMLEVPTDEHGMPDYGRLKIMYRSILKMIESGEILAAAVVKEGGAAACALKMSFGNKVGFIFNESVSDKSLFAPLAGNIIIQVAGTADGILIGETLPGGKITAGSFTYDIDTVIDSWEERLEKVFPSKAPWTGGLEVEIPDYNRRSNKAPAIKIARPRIFIPAFPGTNCEVDTARAFEGAGGDSHIMVVRNLSRDDIEQSLLEMEKGINDAQILMIPGGFSAGDEPEGSGKFIATTLRNPRIADAVMRLLKKREGLILGICNGFQALIKTGLLPYGEITPPKENDPTLTFNTIGRHISKMSYTRISSVKSPWLAGADAGDVFCVPISHGEGRFVADEAAVKALAASGQIATQYASPVGELDPQWNPNGSVCAIEGITSPDGRIFGKMGHSERCGNSLYKNVPGEKDQRIFEYGVKYFK